MIVNNFSMGILGIFLVLAAYYAIGPFVQAINVVLSGGVSWIIAHKLIPFASIFMFVFFCLSIAIYSFFSSV